MQNGPKHSRDKVGGGGLLVVGDAVGEGGATVVADVDAIVANVVIVIWPPCATPVDVKG